MSLIKLSAAIALLFAPFVSHTQPATTGPDGFGQIRPGTVETRPIAQFPYTTAQREEILASERSQRRAGWTPATEEQVGEIDLYLDRMGEFYRLGKRDLNEALPHLRVVPATFDGTPLEQATLDTVMYEGGFVDGAWTGVSRTLTAPKLGRIFLEEYDYVTAGSHIQIAKEITDLEINGLPAMFTVWLAPSGRQLTELEWFTDRKHFRLLLDGAAPPKSARFDQLIELARALK